MDLFSCLVKYGVGNTIVFIKTLFLNKGQHLMYEAKVNSFNVSLVFTEVMESFVLDME
jgi:hypothetical protein